MNAEAEETTPAPIAAAVDVLWQHQPDMAYGHGSWKCTSHTAKSQCLRIFDTYEAFLTHQVEVLLSEGIEGAETVRRNALEEAAAIAETALIEALNIPAATAAEVAEKIRNASARTI